MYAVNPLTNEIVKGGPGVLRVLNFDGGSIHLHGPLQPSDRVYVGNSDDTGIPKEIYGIRRLSHDKTGC